MLYCGEQMYFVESGNGNYSKNYKQKDFNTESYVNDEGPEKPHKDSVAAQGLAEAMGWGVPIRA